MHFCVILSKQADLDLEKKNKINILVNVEWLQHTLNNFDKEIGVAALKGLTIR